MSPRLLKKFQDPYGEGCRVREDGEGWREGGGRMKRKGRGGWRGREDGEGWTEGEGGEVEDGEGCRKGEGEG